MKNIKRTGLLALVLALSVLALTACGGGGSAEDKVIKVAATATPHAEILEHIAPALEEEGWTLEVTVFDGYVQENPATEDGEFDANYFQHVPYLNDWNAENDGHLVVAGNVHYEPMAIFKGTKDSIDALADGDRIAVPNDVTNEARALKLLADNGIIKLKDGVGLEATKADIVENPKNLDIVELEAATIPSARPDVALAVINANYALGAEIPQEERVAYEAPDSEAAETMVNIIAVKEGNENSEKTQALVKAIQTDDVKEFILEKYQGAVQPKF